MYIFQISVLWYCSFLQFCLCILVIFLAVDQSFWTQLIHLSRVRPSQWLLQLQKVCTLIYVFYFNIILLVYYLYLDLAFINSQQKYALLCDYSKQIQFMFNFLVLDSKWDLISYVQQQILVLNWLMFVRVCLLFSAVVSSRQYAEDALEAEE